MDQKQIFKKYQDRLINLSSRNRSLVLNKTYKKRSFDIVLLKHIMPEYYEDIINDFIYGSKEKVLLLPDIKKWSLKTKKELNKIVKKEDAVENIIAEIKAVVGDFTYSNSIIDVKEINVENILNEKTEMLLKYASSIKTLYREVEAVRKETGLYNLKIAVHFVEGRFSSTAKCRAPLSFIPVEIKLKNNEYYLIKTEEEYITNDVLMFSYMKENNSKIIKEDFDEDEYEEEDILDKCLHFYKDNNITIEKTEKEFKVFEAVTADYYKTLNQSLVQKPYLVLGDFPLSNAIYEDYRQLVEKEVNSQQISVLFGLDENGEGIDSRDVKEINYFYTKLLDYSQEKTLKESDTFNNLVIFGPPGTGKSQTITNVIADKLAKNKRVLMVSKKKAALDVIYNRLGDIQSKAVIIHDASNKKDFYRKNAELFERFEDTYGSEFHYKNRKSQNLPDETKVLYKIREISERMEEKLSTLDEVYQFLYQETAEGYTNQELFLHAHSPEYIDENESEIRDIRKLFHEIPATREELIHISENQNNMNPIMNYREYNKYKNKNVLLKEIKDTYSKYDKVEVLDLIDQIVNEKKAFDSYLENPNARKINDLYNKLGDFNKLKEHLEEKLSTEYADLKEPVSKGLSRVIKLIFSKKDLLQKEKENLEKYESILKEQDEKLLILKNHRDQLIEKIDKLNLYFLSEYVDILKDESIKGSLSIDKETFIHASELFDMYKELEENHFGLLLKEKEIVEHISAWDEDTVSLQRFLMDIEGMFATAKIISYEIDGSIKKYKKLIEKNKTLRDEVNELMKEKRELTNDYINVLWDKKFLITSKEYEYRELKRISSLKRRIRPIRKAYNDHFEMLMNLYPCVLLGPETVSEILPLTEMFDVIIFDEASQMFVEESIPSLYRGKSAIISGDDKQLKPNSAFKKRNIDEEEVEEAVFEEESLLDLAKVRYKESNLMYHYRSKYEELINFSNYAFYKGKLKTIPSVVDTVVNPPIERIIVDGRWIERTNKEEAMAIISLLKDLFKNREHNETIGIITFNITQKDLIEELIDEEMTKDEEFNKNMTLELSRKKDNEDVSIFVKNIENVQGDERDIIIFSTAYAKDENGRFKALFGSLSSMGGENRLNVAISRAKRKVYIVTSFEPEMLNVENSKNIGPKMLKSYLEYAKYISEGKYDESTNLLYTMSENTKKEQKNVFDSKIKKEVYDALIEEGYSIKTDVGSSAYKLDIVIYSEKTKKYLLGIEIDGATYNTFKSVKENDVFRQNFLAFRGWNIYRIWSIDWWKERERILSEIRNRISSLEENKNF